MNGHHVRGLIMTLHLSIGCILFTTWLLCACTGTKPDRISPEQVWQSDVPGVVIDYSPAETQRYIGSPSITVLPGGAYIASHDFFGPGSTLNRTAVFASEDKGLSWRKRAEIEGQWWSTLFFHREALYLMGTSRQNGYTVIRRSTDNGRTWTTPNDADTGLLLADGAYHCAPVPTVVHDGRLWRGMEDAMGPDGWGSHFRAFMMSAPEDADLLKAENWTVSNRLGRDPEWLDGHFGGWLEGNAVITPDGHVVDVLRVHNPPEGGKAAIIEISADGSSATFDPDTGFVDFPGGSKKFTIRFDTQSQYYWSLTNIVPDRHRSDTPSRVRNTLALIRSADLRTWEIRSILLHHPDVEKHGFQYVDWLFEGDDLIAVCRTAYDDGFDGAHNQHDANFLTFIRVEQFRQREDLDFTRSASDKNVADQFRKLTRETVWEEVAAIKVDFDTHHPQGMARVNDHLFVSSVEVVRRTQPYAQSRNGMNRSAGAGKGYLFKMHLTGHLIDKIELSDGACYHPGGIDYDGQYLWVPVAEYRPDSNSIIYRVDPFSLQAVEVFRYPDHIGGIVHNTDDRTLHGISWGARRFYTWRLDDDLDVTNADVPPEQLQTINPSYYVDYQDCQYAGDGQALCYGLNTILQAAEGTRFILGGMELLDLRLGRPVHQIPVMLRTDAGLSMLQNPVELETSTNGLRAYFMPEDNTSRLFIYEASL